ncbi:MAG: helix-turn-helix domain-containing protein [Candidatus Paceibacterota bacterium]|jgi:transcriptional regulator with XRE-family HTH domain
MARREDKDKVIKLRLEGLSYSQIKEKTGISKSTLSSWLENYPLSSERIKELRDLSPRRIENFINTMRKKREARLGEIYNQAKKEIGILSDRDLFIAGLFLYWGEGGKTGGTAVVSNTDPAILKFFLKWLKIMNVSKERIKAKVHLYADMDEKKTLNFWSKELGIPISHFNKSYLKKTNLSDLRYKNGFGHGTCQVRYCDKKLANYIMMSIKYFGEMVCS